MAQQEAKSVNDGIANSKDDVQVLKGILARPQTILVKDLTRQQTII